MAASKAPGATASFSLGALLADSRSRAASSSHLLAGQPELPWAQYLTERRGELLQALRAAPAFASLVPVKASTAASGSAESHAESDTGFDTGSDPISQLFDVLLLMVAKHEQQSQQHNRGQGAPHSAQAKPWLTAMLELQAQQTQVSVAALLSAGIHACRYALGERRSLMANVAMRRLHDELDYAQLGTQLRGQLAQSNTAIAQRVVAQLLALPAGTPGLGPSKSEPLDGAVLTQHVTVFLTNWLAAPHPDAQAAQLAYVHGFLQTLVCPLKMRAQEWELLLLTLDRELAALGAAHLYSIVTPATEVLLACVTHFAVFARVGSQGALGGAASPPGLQTLLVVWMALSCRRQARLSAEFFKTVRAESLVAAGFDSAALLNAYFTLNELLLAHCDSAEHAVAAEALSHIISVSASVAHAQTLQLACQPVISRLAASITINASNPGAKARVERQISAILAETVFARALGLELAQSRSILRRRLHLALNTDVDQPAWRQCREIATALAQTSSPNPEVEALLSAVQTLSADVEHIVADQIEWPLFWAEELGLLPASLPPLLAQEIAYITSQAAACLRSSGDKALGQLKRDIAQRWTLAQQLPALAELRAGLGGLNFGLVPKKWRKLQALLLLLSQDLSSLYAGVALCKVASPLQAGRALGPDSTWSLRPIAYLARYGHGQLDHELSWWWDHGTSRHLSRVPRGSMLSNLRELRAHLLEHLPVECSAWVFETCFAPYSKTFGLELAAFEALQSSTGSQPAKTARASSDLAAATQRSSHRSGGIQEHPTQQG